MTLHSILRAWALLLFGIAMTAPGCDTAATVAPGDDVTTDTATGPDAVVVPDVVAPDVDWESKPGGPIARFDLQSDDFTATPWPSDRERLATGNLGLERFPNPDGNDLILGYTTYGETTLDGFSRNGSVYFQLDRVLDTASLPDERASMNDPLASVQWIHLSDGAPDRGKRLPLVHRMVDDPTDIYYLGPTLAVRPVYGFPLADRGTYCVLLTRAATDAEGRYVQPSSAFAAALETEAYLEPLRNWLPESGLAASDIAAATCFRAQDATREMRATAALIETTELSVLSDVKYLGQTTHLYSFTANYFSPNFQSGQKPYAAEGGDILFDDDGLPVIAAWEELRVRILVPRTGRQPVNGWPVVIYGHGTTGDWSTCIDGTEAEAVREGVAMLCIDQPLHGTRGLGGEVDVLQVFNFVNPASGRTSFRQSAADVVYQSRMVAEGRFDMPVGASTFTQSVKFDPDNILFFGHSHGALSGMLVMAVDPRIHGAVLSGGSGVMTETLLRRKDYTDIQALIAVVAGLRTEQLDTFHPVVNLAQLLVDATDPINYAPYWLNPLPGGRAKDVLMFSGSRDEASPAVGADAVAAAAGVPLVNPVDHASPGHELRDLVAINAPLSNNLPAADGTVVSGGFRQIAGGDHFVAISRRSLIDMWRAFFRGYAQLGFPTIAN